MNRLPTRETLAEWSPRLLHPAASPFQCDLITLQRNGNRLVLKDCSRRLFIYRWLVRWTLRREHRSLACLTDAEGVSRLRGWIDRDGLLLEWIDGTRLSRCPPELVTPELFAALDALVASMHRSGVAHGDTFAGNILVDGQGRPHLIDFATAWCRDSLAGRLLFPFVARVDRLTLLHLKRRFLPEALTDDERRRVEHPPFPMRVGRFLRQRVQRPLKPRHWKRRLRKWRRRMAASGSPRKGSSRKGS